MCKEKMTWFRKRATFISRMILATLISTSTVIASAAIIVTYRQGIDEELFTVTASQLVVNNPGVITDGDITLVANTTNVNAELDTTDNEFLPNNIVLEPTRWRMQFRFTNPDRIPCSDNPTITPSLRDSFGNLNRLSGANNPSAWIGATFEPVLHNRRCGGNPSTLRRLRYRVRITIDNIDQALDETEFTGSAEIMLSLI